VTALDERRQGGSRDDERDPERSGDPPIPLGLVHVGDLTTLLRCPDGDHPGVVDEDVEAAAGSGQHVRNEGRCGTGHH
jgi:hypothetical protein